MSAEQHNHDDDVLLAAIARGPTNVNVLYLLPRHTSASDITEAVASAQLVEDGFGLLALLGSEARVTAAVTRCLRSGDLFARYERDPDDVGFRYVVLTTRPRARA